MQNRPFLTTKNPILFLTLVCTLLISWTKGDDMPDYKNPNLPVEKRVADLLARMTLEEKIAQLQCLLSEVDLEKQVGPKGIGNLGCVLRPYAAQKAAEEMNRIQKFFIEKTRLSIPVIMHDEALHGLVGNNATSFPQAIGLAATWNTDLMKEVAAAIAAETKSRGIRQVLSPVVNIARDARWGRVEETYGEDPYLTARMGVAFCKSFEEAGVVTTPKHYAANVGDGGRDSNPVHFSERLMREIYFPAFKACIQEAGARSVMAAYNSYDGIPCSSNEWLLTDVLRKEWGFKGFVVSDYGSIAGMMDLHHTTGTLKETAQQAINAGLDVELPNVYCYGEPLLHAVKEGLVKESTLDESVRRVLAVKFQLGLFENPFVDPEAAGKINDSPAHRQLARRAAQESIVLLKNDGNLLPLKKNLKSIAVIGPDASKVRLGGYSGYGMKTVSILEGIKNAVSAQTEVYYEKGFDIRHGALPPIPSDYLIPAGGKEGEHGLRGEYFTNRDLTGQPALVRIDPQVNFDWGGGSPDPAIPPERFSARWTGKLIAPVTGKCKISVTSDDGARLYVDGKRVLESWLDRGATTDIVTLELEAGRQYDLKIEYYENGGLASMALGWEFKEKQQDSEFEKAVAAAQKSEVVVIVAGIIEGEGQDRALLDLSGPQEELIRAIGTLGKPTAVVLIGGSPITMANWIDSASAVIMAWYPGEEGGNAVADVLFGDYNPAGRLPITFPQHVAQLPLYYNHKPTGRGYDYVNMSGKPLFHFGYGLSYTDFEYSNLAITPAKITPNGKVTVSVEVKNTGKAKGDEVVQLYLHDPVASVARPVKELRGFQRISLAPGEQKRVTFELTRDDLAFLDRKMNYIVEPGTIDVMIGSSSELIRLRGSFEVVQQ
ncbi:MAG: glycoside hydrolase family 3 C-terminal domain-containing protein [candidate division KSB1 bacterium]|nr:glycoside hydrolase family 3 C-terminal domain-containing protein [candidate division KSB1 bacterium]MDZ7304742.1 glycoside hydrolase family 3 C-terminal domain-containing protein [candidate division KSB1 bacterium]MDZ7313845.1 glycoside hydrolase family 3 C-terminal domain-containing protein [candidate division KSB1 bacterium]